MTALNLHHTRWPEKDYLTQGTAEHQVFETSYGRVGMLVCWDLAWPEASRALLLAGCDVVIAPTCWLATDATETGLARDPDSEKKFLNALIPLRAWENECCVVFCNCGGDEDQGWLGQTGVAVPFQGWIGQAVSPGLNLDRAYFVTMLWPHPCALSLTSMPFVLMMW